MSLIWPEDLNFCVATKLGGLLRRAPAVFYVKATSQLRRAISLAKKAFLKGIKDFFKSYFITA